MNGDDLLATKWTWYWARDDNEKDWVKYDSGSGVRLLFEIEALIEALMYLI